MTQPGSTEVSAVARKARVRTSSGSDTKDKIIVAARHLFAELGYDRATLRQIAAKAGLTVGALFHYVTDKRDLIHLIFNEDVDALTDRALASPRRYHSFAEKILSITEHLYRHFAVDPVLSRILLSEILVETAGLHLERNLSIRERLIHGIRALTLEAQGAGEVLSSMDAEMVALQIFFIHAACLRRWLASSPRPDWRTGQKAYEQHLNLQLQGFLRPVRASKSASLRRSTR